MVSRIRCWACNAEWPAATAKCYKCGQPLGGGGSAATYAAEAPSSQAFAELTRQAGIDPIPSAVSGVYSDGDKLVMTEGCEMPRRCPLCNSEEVFETTDLDIRRSSKEMGGISGVLKAGADALSGWNYTGPVSVSVYFCERHRVRFRNWLILGAVIALVSIAYLVVLYYRSGGWDPDAGPSWDAIVAVVGAIGGVTSMIIYAQSPARAWFTPKRFVDRTVWVKGACREFLDSLPKVGGR